MPINPKGSVERHVGYKPGLSYFLEIQQTEIAAWSPGKPEEKLPATQVHFIQTVKDFPAKLVVRFKGPDTLGFLIEELIKYRRDVWPDSEKVTGEK